VLFLGLLLRLRLLLEDFLIGLLLLDLEREFDLDRDPLFVALFPLVDPLFVRAGLRLLLWLLLRLRLFLGLLDLLDDLDFGLLELLLLGLRLLLRLRLVYDEEPDLFLQSRA